MLFAVRCKGQRRGYRSDGIFFKFDFWTILPEVSEEIQNEPMLEILAVYGPDDPVLLPYPVEETPFVPLTPEEIRAHIAAQSAKLQAQEVQFEAQSASLEQGRTDVEALRAEVARLRSEKETRQSQFVAQTEALARAQSETDALRGEVEALRAQIQALSVPAPVAEETIAEPPAAQG